MSRGTALRAVRVDGPLWDKAQEVAKENGTNVSAIIREALRNYIQETRTNEHQ